MAKKSAGEGSSENSGIKLVIVESPTKAKTIRKFLGKDYIVESCMGHIRDLPQSAKDIPEKVKKEKWSSLGVNVDNNFDPIYCIPRDKHKVVKNLKDKLAEASELYLATDEDREGESISWHLTEVLKPKVPTKRMVFHEITKEAIHKALKDTREIDFNLVAAQEARRILDRLVGYTVSPLLWKKVAYGLSAGRVQSVAVRLITERELERIKFKKAQYWGVLAELEQSGVRFESRLQTLKGQRVATGKDFDGTTGKLLGGKDVQILGEAQAKQLATALKSQAWIVSEVEEKPTTRKPAAPFITSTLQQEANRKLGLSSRETMQVAQKLYEQGFITYMRTDSTFLSTEAIQAARSGILSKYGKEYLPAEPRSYAAKKVKGAQEAHEAIRPAGTEFQDPDATGLAAMQLRLYELIWMRTVASQMVDARQKQVSAKISVGEALFSASGMTIEFPGFLRAYVEGSDDPEADLLEREVRLPALKAKDNLQCADLNPTEHETKPPARFTEASLVQTMEKEGIGRPSTYASIIGTIIDRGYVKKQASALVPTFTAMVVSKLLRTYLSKFVDLGFTSQMERSLDSIADGELNSQKYLESVYFGKEGLKNQVESQADKIDPDEARAISLDGLEMFSFRVGKYGAYVCTQRDGAEVCASIPESESPADMTALAADKLIDQKINGADALGEHPESGLPIYVLNGRYGPYVQLGEVTSTDDKPKRVSIPPTMSIENLTLEQALELLSLPKTLGLHPQLQKEIKAGLGRFGPFVVCDGDYRSIPKTESLFTITLEKALELFAQPKKGRGKAAPLKEFGPHPTAGDDINVMNGPYGPYIKCGKINVSLPEGTTPEEMTLEKAVELLADKISTAKPSKKSAKSTAAKTASAQKPAKTKVEEADPSGKNAGTKSAAAKAPAKKAAKAKTKAKSKPPPFPEVVKAKSPGPAQATVIRRTADKRA
jgi:DNA topoisomerase-1